MVSKSSPGGGPRGGSGKCITEGRFDYRHISRSVNLCRFWCPSSWCTGASNHDLPRLEIITVAMAAATMLGRGEYGLKCMAHPTAMNDLALNDTVVARGTSGLHGSCTGSSQGKSGSLRGTGRLFSANARGDIQCLRSAKGVTSHRQLAHCFTAGLAVVLHFLGARVALGLSLRIVAFLARDPLVAFLTRDLVATSGIGLLLSSCSTKSSIALNGFPCTQVTNIQGGEVNFAQIAWLWLQSQLNVEGSHTGVCCSACTNAVWSSGASIKSKL